MPEIISTFEKEGKQKGWQAHTDKAKYADEVAPLPARKPTYPLNPARLDLPLRNPRPFTARSARHGIRIAFSFGVRGSPVRIHSKENIQCVLWF
jgi:hypothetical protein